MSPTAGWLKHGADLFAQSPPRSADPLASRLIHQKIKGIQSNVNETVTPDDVIALFPCNHQILGYHPAIKAALEKLQKRFQSLQFEDGPNC